MKIPLRKRTRVDGDRGLRARVRWNGATGAGVACAAIVAGAQLSSVAGCVMPQVAATPASSLTSAEAARTPPAAPSLFKLKPEWTGPCARADVVDVNLGHSREAFVNAAYCQITGQKAPEATVAEWAARLRQNPKTRRVDVVRSLALAEKRTLKLRYSDPWESQPDLGAPPDRKNPRDVGAVFMFFFNCPGGVNCGMDWANTHAVGMDAPSPLLGVERGQSAVYSPSEQGFWRRELLDAKYAGLQFLLLNTYGPDIEDGKLAPLARALDALDAPVKIALFDDTWTWGQPYFREFWKQKPDLAKTEKAANLLYEAKWKPFFSQIDKKHWYRFQGRPFIYFYNSGTLEPRERSASVLAKMKERFKTEFGEEPFVAVDGAYFADQDMPRVADSRFNWMTFNSPDKRSRSRLNGHVVDHAMVKWDAVGRDRPGEIATERDRIIKDSALLEKVLADSSDADILVLATWNDLGEGTGVNRNYDYYADGHWLAPDHFMRLIRDSQSAPRR